MSNRVSIFLKLKICFFFSIFIVYPIHLSWSNVEDPRGILMAHILGISAPELLDLRTKTMRLMQMEGVSVEVTNRITTLDTLSLLNILNIDFDRREADHERLIENLRYWRALLGVHGTRDLFEEFVTQTKHNNPFHILNMNLQGWVAFLDMLVEWQVFTSVNGHENTSFRSFAIQHKWLEGVHFSLSKQPEFWRTWSEALFLSGFQPEEIGEAIYKKFVLNQNQLHRDSIQSLYVTLSPDLLEFFLEHAEFMKIKSVSDAFLINPIVFTFITDQLVHIFNRYLRNPEFTVESFADPLDSEIRSFLETHSFRFEGNVLKEWVSRKPPSNVYSLHSCGDFLK